MLKEHCLILIHTNSWKSKIIFALNQGSSSFEDLNEKCIAKFVPDRKGDFYLNEVILNIAKISINNKSKNVDGNNKSKNNGFCEQMLGTW